MDKVFIRNFVVFTALLLLCTFGLSYSLVRGERELGRTDDLVLHAHEIVSETEQLSTLTEAMLAAQRGYLLTSNPAFMEEYESHKAQASERIAVLSGLIDNKPEQKSRLDEIRRYFTDLSILLEDRLEEEEAGLLSEENASVTSVDRLKNNILRINASMQDKERLELNEQIYMLGRKKSEYFNTLLVSVSIGTVLLLAFNGFLLRAQRRRSLAETSLKDTEARYSLAIDGTRDGIFDWDIRSGDVFYSRRYFEMLGYDTPAHTGTLREFKDIVHPEDLQRLWQNVEGYLNNEVSEYHQEFRMRHKSGRWMWIQSRAKALYDDKGNAIRMVGAHTDITSAVKTKERLEAEKLQAEESNRAKSEFLAHMSHEIRTPLTAISGIAEIFDKIKGEMSEKPRALVRTLLSSTATLKDLINDILDFSKIEGGELELANDRFALDDIFENVISMMAFRAYEKGINFSFDYTPVKNIDFQGDAIRIRQILVNLINNAVKFTEKGGVSVKAAIEERYKNEFLRIDIHDTGIGIAPDNFELVFERFKQADSSVSRKYGGTGLGLPISRNLARLMGGDILLSSTLGQGSTFTLILPMTLPSGELRRTPKEKSVRLSEQIKSSVNNKDKILLVEDYEGNIVVIGYILDDLGIEYDLAQTGGEALNLWEKNTYRIILMDIQMPGMDGFSATRAIRSREEEDHMDRTPIIGMTAHALVGDKDKCIEAGMDSYLPKPIVEADLKKEIFKFLKKRNRAA